MEGSGRTALIERIREIILRHGEDTAGAAREIADLLIDAA